MKKIEITKMETLQAGGWLDCVGAGLGVAGLVVAVASLPVTGPIGVGAVIGLATGSIGTGLSLAGCINL